MYNFILIFTFLFLNTHAANDGNVVYTDSLVKKGLSSSDIFKLSENWIVLLAVYWDSASRRFQPKFEKAYA